MAEGNRIVLKQRAYAPSDLTGVYLVFGATSDMALNDRIHQDAEAQSILCNIADFPKSCNFILPSVVQRGDLQIAISTSGKSPAFARFLRKELENRYGDEYGDFHPYEHIYEDHYEGKLSFKDFLNHIAALVVVGARKGADDMIGTIYQAFLGSGRLPIARRRPKRVR